MAIPDLDTYAALWRRTPATPSGVTEDGSECVRVVGGRVYRAPTRELLDRLIWEDQ